MLGKCPPPFVMLAILLFAKYLALIVKAKPSAVVLIGIVFFIDQA